MSGDLNAEVDYLKKQVDDHDHEIREIHKKLGGFVTYSEFYFFRDEINKNVASAQQLVRELMEKLNNVHLLLISDRSKEDGKKEVLEEQQAAKTSKFKVWHAIVATVVGIITISSVLGAGMAEVFHLFFR
jgi:hypothetical protein